MECADFTRRWPHFALNSAKQAPHPDESIGAFRVVKQTDERHPRGFLAFAEFRSKSSMRASRWPRRSVYCRSSSTPTYGGNEGNSKEGTFIFSPSGG